MAEQRVPNIDGNFYRNLRNIIRAWIAEKACISGIPMVTDTLTDQAARVSSPSDVRGQGNP